MKTIRLTIHLEVSCLDGKEYDVLDVVDTMLENGVVQDPLNDRGEDEDLGECAACNGFGEKDDEQCDECHGRGGVVAWHVTSAAVRRVA